MEIDQELLKKVSVALTKGQGKWTEEQLAAAYEQVFGDKIAGTLATMLEEGFLVLKVREDGEIVYGAMGNDEISASVEALIRSTRSPGD